MTSFFPNYYPNYYHHLVLYLTTMFGKSLNSLFSKIRWIYDEDNLANVITKKLSNLVLKGIILISKVIIKLKR